jgi:sec-independent protein translocase protein TatB
VFLFILESIGTSELILIGIVALIFLGPRKLPEIAKTIGKAMAEFRKTTNDFKSTWEREVNFEEEEAAVRTGDLPEEPVARITAINAPLGEVSAPEVKEIDQESFERLKQQAAAPEPAPVRDDPSDKRSWL